GVSAGGISHTAGTGGIATSSGSLAGSTARGVAGASGVAMLVGGGAAGRSALGGMAGTLASGGSSTGGVATGGAATGGVATGGAPAAVTVARECPTTPLQCGAESCCTTIKVPGGTFKMGRSTAQGTSDYYQAAMGSRENELPEHDATVATFALDKYEVTVGRFREFLSRYDTWHKAIPANPKLGSGTNPNVEASSVASTGWGGSWTVSGNELPADATALRSLLNGDGGNWTDNAEDGHERYPINYLTWYLAFAFCIWDGARLPTEAEWEYAAAGGSENRLFPWIGSAIDTTRANYWSSLSSPALDVGSYPAGVGAFGHMDLAGSMYEWVMDSYSYPYYGSGTPTPCKSCVFFTAGDTDRVIRGGAFGSTAIDLRAAYRSSASTTLRGGDHGFRCARDL
ncbi:MAG TPA: SUMF1/EgtB/PvdO family nonheme iron enzyme, partial [Polyangiaceae bacterium]